MFISNKPMTITKANNGWILQLPSTNVPGAESIGPMMEQMIGGIDKTIKNRNLGIENGQEETFIMPPPLWPKPGPLVDANTYVFSTFHAMMVFIEMTFEDLEKTERPDA